MNFSAFRTITKLEGREIPYKIDAMTFFVGSTVSELRPAIKSKNFLKL